MSELHSKEEIINATNDLQEKIDNGRVPTVSGKVTKRGKTQIAVTASLMALTIMLSFFSGCTPTYSETTSEASITCSSAALNWISFVEKPTDELTTFYYYNPIIDSEYKLQEFKYSDEEPNDLPEGAIYRGHETNEKGTFMLIEFPGGVLFKVSGSTTNLDLLNAMGKNNYENIVESQKESDVKNGIVR